MDCSTAWNRSLSFSLSAITKKQTKWKYGKWSDGLSVLILNQEMVLNRCVWKPRFLILLVGDDYEKVKVWTLLEHHLALNMCNKPTTCGFLCEQMCWRHSGCTAFRSRLANNNTVNVMSRLRDFPCEHRDTSKAAIQQWDGSWLLKRKNKSERERESKKWGSGGRERGSEKESERLHTAEYKSVC